MSYVAPHEYFGLWANHPDATDEVRKNAEILLKAVNGLMDDAYLAGIDLPTNPSTQCHVSGTTYGGFRPQDCTQGAPNSSHKTGQGIDIYDGKLRDGQPLAIWCLNNQTKLQAHGLYMEHPNATKGVNTSWCHLTTRSPKSGRRVFYP